MSEILALLLLFTLLVIAYIRGGGKIGALAGDKNWYTQLTLSKEDAISQVFFLLAFWFFGITLATLNSRAMWFFSWDTILFWVSVIGLVSSYRLHAVYVLLFSLVGLGNWWIIKALSGVEETFAKSSIVLAELLLLALLLYIIGRLHKIWPKRKRFSMVYTFPGLLIVTGILFLLSTKWGIISLGEMTHGNPVIVSGFLTLFLLIFFLASIGGAVVLVRRAQTTVTEGVALAMLGVLFTGLALLPPQEMLLPREYVWDHVLSGTGMLWALFFNMLLFLEIVGLVFVGYLRRETWLINIGAFFIVVFVFVKYFDWFFNSLDKSIFFIGAGLLLFVAGWLMEKGIRYVLSAVREQSPTNIP